MVIEGLNLPVTIALGLAALGLIAWLVAIGLGNKLIKSPPSQEKIFSAFKRVLWITYFSATVSLISIVILVFQFIIKITFNVDFDVNMR